MTTRRNFLGLTAAATAVPFGRLFADAAPVGSRRPLPNARQVEWHDAELGMFFHWDISVMRWQADGNPNPAAEGRKIVPASCYNPTKLDTDQWMEAAKALGAKYAIFTAKHGQGFLQWQSNAYDYSMKQSPYLGGKGDVVKMFVDSCRRYGIKPGLYLSFDNNLFQNAHGFKVKGGDAAAQRHYREVCEKYAAEIWGNYGELFEIWIDGGLPPAELGFELEPLVMKYQPNALVFGGQDKRLNLLRWSENEDGYVKYPSPATDGDVWQPYECATPLQHNFRWFWKPGCEQQNRGCGELVSAYYHIVGRNGNFLLGATPGPDGMIPQADMELYRQTGDRIRSCFGSPLGRAMGEGDVLTIRLSALQEVNQISIREDIARGGERIRAYLVEGKVADGTWAPLCAGTVVGHRRAELFRNVPVSEVRLRVLSAWDKPLIRDFEVFCAKDLLWVTV